MSRQGHGQVPNENQMDTAQKVAAELDLTTFEAEPESACARGYRFAVGGVLSIVVNSAGQIVDANLSRKYRTKLTTRVIERVEGSYRIKFHDGMYLLEKDMGADGYEQRGSYKTLSDARSAVNCERYAVLIPQSSGHTAGGAKSTYCLERVTDWIDYREALEEIDAWYLNRPILAAESDWIQNSDGTMKRKKRA